VEGGGQCDLSNMRTLCLLCHRRTTAALRERLKLTN
jgi:5-methylcytosine-specific restriction enzyme A